MVAKVTGMIRSRTASAAIALLLASAGPLAIGAALAQPAPPPRPGTVAPDDKADNPVTPNVPQRSPAATLERLTDCPCDGGCPACVVSPKCGSGNQPLDKAGAAVLVASLTRGHR